MLTDESNAIPTWTGAPMTADRPVKLSELVAKRIADDIVADGLAPGARLPGEKEMLDRLQVSRGTLREALRILEVHGLLVIRSGPGGGPTVAQMTASDFSRVCSLHFRAAGITLDQLWSDRAEIETMLARLAAHNITDEHRERLHALTQQRTEDVVGNVEKYVETASAFHQLIAEASGSPVLSLFARSLGEMTARLARLGVYQPSEHKRVHRAHLDIGEAILAGNAELAEKLASEHMQDMRDTHRQRYPAMCDNLLPYII